MLAIKGWANYDTVFGQQIGKPLPEDGDGTQYLRGLTQRGDIFDFARNLVYESDASEFTGVCFSPDSRFLFVNLQSPGVTCAIWVRGSAARSKANSRARCRPRGRCRPRAFALGLWRLNATPTVALFVRKSYQERSISALML